MNPTLKVNLQKQRTMRYFIDAAKQIAEKEGIEKLSIRKIADLAGYNSATIYNYFENIDSLVAFAMIDSVTDYLNGFDYILSKNLDPITTLLLSWRLYAECSFPNPGAYQYVFSSENSNFALSKLKSYYDIFPINNQNVNNIVTNQDMVTRNRLLYAPCFEQGYFDKSKEDYIIDFCYIVHGGFSSRIITRGLNSEEAVPLFLDYLTEFLQHHILKDSKKIPSTKDILKIDYHKL